MNKRYTCLRGGHAFKTRASLRMPHRVAPLSRRPRQTRQTKRPRAESKESIRIPDHHAHQDAALPAISVEQEALFTEALGQTVFVEKDAAELSNAVPAAPLRHAEVVPDSPSFNLVRTAQPVDRRRQNRRILAEIVAIAVPALGTVLADPLMSLVDTACVGQISAVQLAALGPNTAIFNMIFAIFSFMGAALANRLARNSIRAPGLSKDEKSRRRKQNETVLSHTLMLAVGLGLAVTGLLFAFGPMLLRWMGTSPVVMKAALQYLLVRAIATPAVFFIAVSQGACLGQQDMWTPMKVVLVAGFVNLVGDVGLIMKFGLGTIGAAAATAAANIAGAVFFFHYLCKGGADGKAVRLKWKGLPTQASLQPIIQMGRVLVSRNFVLMLAYTGMTAVATTMGTLTLAAHQVALQLFWFLSYVPEPLSLTAQSLIARDRNDRNKIRSLSRVLVKFGAYSGLILAALFGVSLTLLARCFTSDVAVIAAFQKTIPHGVIALVLLSLSSMFDGICIGSSQFEHLPSIMYASTAATLGFQWLTLRLNLGLSGIWASMIVFFAFRNLLHVAHLIRNWNISPFSAFAPSFSLEPQLATN